MMYINYFAVVDDANRTPDDFEFRLDTTKPPAIGSFAWMNPDTKAMEWQVINTHLFQSESHSVCVAQLAKDEVTEVAMPDAIHFYLLDGEIYQDSLCGGSEVVPSLGDYHEYAPITCQLLPITKRVTSFEELKGHAPYKVYIANLERELIAAY